MRHKDRVQILERKVQTAKGQQEQPLLRRQITREEWLQKYCPTWEKEGDKNE